MFVEIAETDLLALSRVVTLGPTIHNIPCDPVAVAKHATERELAVLLALVTHPSDPDSPHLASIHPDLFALANAATRLYTGRTLEVCGSDGYRLVVSYPGKRS